ncbi:hypothetical protein HaLaN_24466 [Haematococcus lacustris]|uniref:Uncharacterized protein n=1 Tax=Haematococcus lacustris TaxID=44745 RepID=A0A699ZUG4_HAELA|nr:hypothetical protein HaLaN_24466 [Haematococcus lacustris]
MPAPHMLVEGQPACGLKAILLALLAGVAVDGEPWVQDVPSCRDPAPVIVSDGFGSRGLGWLGWCSCCEAGHAIKEANLSWDTPHTHPLAIRLQPPRLPSQGYQSQLWHPSKCPAMSPPVAECPSPGACVCMTGLAAGGGQPLWGVPGHAQPAAPAGPPGRGSPGPPGPLTQDSCPCARAAQPATAAAIAPAAAGQQGWEDAGGCWGGAHDSTAPGPASHLPGAGHTPYVRSAAPWLPHTLVATCQVAAVTSQGPWLHTAAGLGCSSRCHLSLKRAHCISSAC